MFDWTGGELSIGTVNVNANGTVDGTAAGQDLVLNTLNVMGASALVDTGSNGLTVSDGGTLMAGRIRTADFTVAGGTRELNAAGRSDPSMIYFKIGYKAKLSSVGSTNFYINYQETDDLASDGDEATYWGLGVVQILKDYATELFAAFSIAEFEDTSTSSYEDLATGLVGARLKF